MRIVAVIPCYNEEKTIAKVVEQTREHTDAVVVVDNNCVDNTVVKAAIAGARIVRCLTKGAGAATQKGIEVALNSSNHADIIVTLDGDGQHNPDDIPRIVQPIIEGKADFVLGTRFSNGKVEVPGYRQIGIKAVTWLYNLFSSKPVSDSQCCLRAYSKEAAQLANITENGFGFSIEVLAKIRHKGLRIAEVPVNCIYHKDYKQNSTYSPIKLGIIIVVSILKWRIRLEMGNSLKYIIYHIIKIGAAPIRIMGLSGNNILRKVYKWLMPRIVPDSDKVFTINNYKIRTKIDEPRDKIGVAQLISFSKVYDPTATAVCKKLIEPGMKCIDVGANIGYYTLLFSSLVKHTGKVWTFEPDNNNYKELTDNIKLNNFSNILPFKVAVGNQNGNTQLFTSPNSTAMNSVITRRSNYDTSVTVSITKLDRWPIDPKINFLKTDTEGNDLAVLEGAKQLISRSPDINVLFEVWLDGLALQNLTVQQVINRIQALGLNYIYLINERNKTVILTTDEMIIKYSHSHGEGCNLLCTKRTFREGYYK